LRRVSSGSLALPTAFAEMAYYRLVFLDDCWRDFNPAVVA
jgi:hypothetical protein